MKNITLLFLIVFLPVMLLSQVISEDFESVAFGDIPVGWTLSEGDIYTNDFTANNGAQSLYMSVYFNDPFWIMSSTISTPHIGVAINTLNLTFSANFSDNVLVVGTMSDPSDPFSFTPFEEITASGGAWSEYVVDFSTYAGTDEYIAFQYYWNGIDISEVYIDDVVIEETAVPDCVAPSALSSSLVTQTSATISWTAPNPAPLNGYEYYVSTNNVPPAGSGTAIAGTSKALTLLSAGTPYYFWVRSMCDGAESSWSAGNFTTLCNSVNLPFTETFENASTTVNCWTKITDAGTQSWTVSAANNHTSGGSKSAFFAEGNNVGGKFISPSIVLPSSTALNLTFYSYSVIDGGDGTNKVLISTNGGGSYSQIWSETSDVAPGWTLKTIDISSYAGNTVLIAFQYITGFYTHDWYFDDVSIIINENLWTGDVSTEWNNAANWTLGVPTSDDNAIIQNVANKPLISSPIGSNAACENLTIYSGASVTIADGSALTVHGNLVNNGGILIKSTPFLGGPEGYDGSLIVLGNSSGIGQCKVEKYISSGKWHCISSPVTNATFANLSGAYLKPYDEPGNTWGDYIESPYSSVPVGTGYIAWSNTNVTKTFVGKFSNSTVGPIALTRTNAGFNMVGNPYTSAINWTAGSGWTKTNIGGTSYIWNNGQWDYHNGITWVNEGNPYIAVGQGFLVQALAGGGSITMNKNIQEHNVIKFKNTQDEIDGLIRVRVTGNGYQDECVLYVENSSENEYDPKFDATKFYGTGAAPQIYTMKGNEKVAINTQNLSDNIVGKGIYVEVGEKVPYILKFNHTMNSYFEPVLKDLVTNNLIYAGQEYSFVTSPDDDPLRFEILRNTTGISTMKDDSPAIWTNDKLLFVDNIKNNNNFSIEIYNILGVKILQSSTYITDLNSLSSGIYIVNLIIENKIYSRKISLE